MKRNYLLGHLRANRETIAFMIDWQIVGVLIAAAGAVIPALCWLAYRLGRIEQRVDRAESDIASTRRYAESISHEKMARFDAAMAELQIMVIKHIAKMDAWMESQKEERG